MAKNKLTFNIKATAEILVPNKSERNSYLVALAIIGVMIGMISLVMPRLGGVVPLYFSLPWGEARLAPRVALYLLPILSLGVVVVNIGLGRLLRGLSPLLPRILASGALLLAIMMLVAGLGIVQSLSL